MQKAWLKSQTIAAVEVSLIAPVTSKQASLCTFPNLILLIAHLFHNTLKQVQYAAFRIKSQMLSISLLVVNKMFVALLVMVWMFNPKNCLQSSMTPKTLFTWSSQSGSFINNFIINELIDLYQLINTIMHANKREIENSNPLNTVKSVVLTYVIEKIERYIIVFIFY